MGTQTSLLLGVAAMLAADVLVGLVLFYLWRRDLRERHVGW